MQISNLDGTSIKADLTGSSAYMAERGYDMVDKEKDEHHTDYTFKKK